MQEKNSESVRGRAAKDELSHEVVLGIGWDRHGLTIGGRSRFLAATDRLLGATVGIPAGYFEGIRERVELRNAFRREAILEAAQQALPTAGGGDIVAEATVRRLASEAVEKQMNRESVWQKTKELLTASMSTPEPIGEPRDSEELDRDWMNLFATYAERASSERLQTLWSQILAGEVRKPRSFSLSTLRVISEIDAEIAELFQEVAAQRLPIGNQMALIKPTDFGGEILLRWTFLEEIGLLQGVGSGFNFSMPGTAGERFGFFAGGYVLAGVFKPDDPEIRLHLVNLTRAARQIARILPQDPLGALDTLADRIGPNVAQRAVYRGIERPDKHFQRYGAPLKVFPDD